MKVLLIGSGGREHALAAALNRDTTLEELHVAPGNPGIAEIALCHAIDITENNAVVELAKRLNIDLVFQIFVPNVFVIVLPSSLPHPIGLI